MVYKKNKIVQFDASTCISYPHNTDNLISARLLIATTATPYRAKTSVSKALQGGLPQNLVIKKPWRWRAINYFQRQSIKDDLKGYTQYIAKNSALIGKRN